MTTLSESLERYLAERRAFGADLAFTERVLRKFVQFTDEAGRRHLSTDLFLAWKAAYGRASNGTWAARLIMVRGFGRWLASRDPLTEVPPAGLIPSPRAARKPPYIYAPEEITALVDAAGRLPSPYGLRARTWQTLYGLIAVTGLRVNEALGLERGDIDPGRGLLHVRRSKNGTEQVLPVHASTTVHLANYAAERNRLLGRGGAGTRFFLGEDGAPAGDCGARYNFAEVGRMTGLRDRQRYHRHGRGPRIHDLRHTFAVRTILGWFREGRDVDREMYRLSAYLGHTNPAGTYWYIEAVPELLDLAAARAEARWRGGAA